MFKGKTICVVVPAFNEDHQIKNVIDTMPEFVDNVVVVDDSSTDGTIETVEKCQDYNEKLLLIKHRKNEGVGAAISTGYKWAKQNKMDVTAVMAGDGQMDPEDLESIIIPVVRGEIDYSKGNRLFFGNAWDMIPHHRYLGNSLLSLFTKIASGYWHIADSQSGYTAISLQALNHIDLDKIYKRYGVPNDILIKLNQYNIKIRDISVKPIYNIGEKSGIKLPSVIPKLIWLLFKGFWKRMFFKYVILDFHPLVFFYLFSFILLGASLPLTVRLFYIWFIYGDIPDINAMALVFTLISALQTAFFGMWFDMEYNKDLK